jgi:Holliday junction resolvase
LVNSRRKGHDAEIKAAAMLKRITGHEFVQTPGSGSGKIKGDLMVEHKKNLFCIEIKHYKDMGFNHKVFTQKSNVFVNWWSKLCKQSEQMNQEPLLIFKENHSQWYVATTRKPLYKKHMYINWLGCYVTLADKFLETQEVKFTNGDTIYEPWKANPEWELIDC